MNLYKITARNKLRIAVSGKSGCGNTTVSTLLSQKLGVTLINFTFRQLAAEKNMTLQQVLEAAKTDSSYDKEVDTRQVELAKKTSCVLGSRLAVWMLKEADLKVFLIAEPEVRAARIQNREGGELSEIMAFTQKRDLEDSERYKKLYQIDNTKYDFCDLIIDTAKYNPEQITELIINKLVEKKLVEIVKCKA
ncbi:MAG: AAA family ATPase [Treponema sp.]|jgi:cytidylate kinase|nr:AAA family ATPase [Treponema sp.]